MTRRASLPAVLCIAGLAGGAAAMAAIADDCDAWDWALPVGSVWCTVFAITAALSLTQSRSAATRFAVTLGSGIVLGGGGALAIALTGVAYCAA